MKRMNCFTRYINMYMVKRWNIGPDNNKFVETETRSFATKKNEVHFFFMKNSLLFCCQIALLHMQHKVQCNMSQRECSLFDLISTKCQEFCSGGNRYHFPSPQQGQKGLTMGRH